MSEKYSEENISGVPGDEQVVVDESVKKTVDAFEEDSDEGFPTKWVIIGLLIFGGVVLCGVIAIFTAITINAVDPAGNFESARNTQRSSDISAILNAITQYTAEGNPIQGLAELTDFEGEIPSCSIDSPSTEYVGIANDLEVGGPNQNEEEYLNLEKVLAPDYLIAIPEDPSGFEKLDGNGVYTGYSICLMPDAEVQIVATETEKGMENLYVVR